MKPINRFDPIVITTAQPSTLVVSITSTHAQPIVNIVGNDSYYTYTNGTNLEIHPSPEWPSASVITVSVTEGTTKYIVAENIYNYDPYSYLYSSNKLGATDPLQELQDVGLCTREEKDLIDNLYNKSSRLPSTFNKISKAFLRIFNYDSTAIIPKVTSLLFFRKSIYLMYLYGLESVVTYYSLDLGPTKDWYLNAYINGCFSDEEIHNNLDTYYTDFSRLINTMTTKNLNVDIVEALDQHIDPSSKQHKMLRYIVTLLIALRYADNGKFNY